MDIRVVTEKEYNTRHTKSNYKFINMLTQEEKQMYLTLYSTYAYFFTKYLIKKLNLQYYDQELKSSSLNFVKVKEKQLDIYKFLSYNSLDYLYIRNNIYIERLSKENKIVLLTRFKSNNLELDLQMENLIETTYKELIFEDVLHNKAIYQVNRNPSNEQYKAPNNALILGIRYDELALTTNTNEEWNLIHEKQIQTIKELITRIKLNEKTKLDIPLVIFQYNDYSTNKIE